MNIHQAFSIPHPQAVAELVMRDGAIIRLRRHGRAGATRLVLSHGNGLAINAYSPFWVPLAQDFDLVLFDMRNHGDNPLHRQDAHTWENFYADIEEIFQGIDRHFGAARTVGAFHSLSSLAVLQHALRYGKRLDALCVFDPPIMPPEGHPLHAREHEDMERMSARAARRQAVFDSPDQLASQFRRRGSFARWVREGADLMARHTLRRRDDGRWTLCCPPAYEAYVFRENLDATLYGRLPNIPMPLMIIAGDPNSPYASPAALTAKAAHEELGVDYAFVPDTTHFLQIEEPAICRELLRGFLVRHGLI